MAIESGSLLGGTFRTEAFIHDIDIASGQTGDLITIGTAGKVSTITYLQTVNTSQAGIGIVVDGVPLAILGSLSGVTTAADNWLVSERASNVNESRAVVPSITGEFITITKDAGNTTQGLNLSYVTGVLK